jgi:hypothetical protein
MEIIERYPDPLYLSLIIIAIVAGFFIYRGVKRKKKSQKQNQ